MHACFKFDFTINTISSLYAFDFPRQDFHERTLLFPCFNALLYHSHGALFSQFCTKTATVKPA